MSDPDVLASVEAAIQKNKSVKVINIQCNLVKWGNVATAILKGAAKKTSLKTMFLWTPDNLYSPQDVVDEVRKANPQLKLIVLAGSESASHGIT